MANDIDTKLVLQLTADIKSLQRSLRAANDDVARTTTGIEKSFASTDANVKRTTDSISKSISHSAQNIKFQLGDIATQIGSGTSALQAFAQQSGQLGQAISQGGIKAVGAALTGMLNPLYLIPTAISLAMPAIQSFFAETEEGGEDAAKAIQAQRDLIRQVAEEWGQHALPALTAYNERLTEQEKIAKAIAGVQAGRDKAQADASSAIEKTSAALGKILPLFERFPKLAGQVGELKTQWEQLQQNIQNGTATLAEVEALQAKFNSTLAKLPLKEARDLAVTIRSDVIPALREQIGTMERLRDLQAQLATRQENMRIQGRMNLPAFNPELSTVPAELAGRDAAGAFIQGAQERLKELEPEFAATLQAFMDAAPGKISINSGRRSTERQAELWREALAKHGSVAEARKWVAPPGHSMHEKGGAADLGYETEAVKRWAHENAAAYGLVFRLKNEDWHIELARSQATEATARAQQNQTTATGQLASGTLALTDAQRAQIDEQERQRQASEQWAQQTAQMTGQALSGFISDLRQGVSAGDAFKNMVGRIVDQMIEMAIQMAVIKPLFNLLNGGRGIVPGLPFPAAPTMHRGTGGGTRDMRSVSPAIFANAPRLHNGLNPGEFPAILQQGERVIPRSVVRRGQGNVGSTVVNLGDVQVDVATGMVTASNEDARDLGRQIDTAVQAVLVRESRPGGLLRQAGK